MIYSEMQVRAMDLFKSSSDRHACDVHIRVSYGQSAKVFLVEPGRNQQVLVYEYPEDDGMNLCAAIYQGLSDVAECVFDPNRCQTAQIKNQEYLPETLTHITVRTISGKSGFDMILRLQYSGERQEQSDGDIASDLAARAIKLLDEKFFVVYSDLDVDRPETITNLERFKDVLMMAYHEGQLNPLISA